MLKDIVVSIVSAAIGAVLAVIGSGALGLFKGTITDGQVEMVAKHIIDTETERNVLLLRMEKSGKFLVKKDLEELKKQLVVSYSGDKSSPVVKAGGNGGDILPHDANCPEGSFVTGIQVQSHSDSKIAVHQVVLTCIRPIVR